MEQIEFADGFDTPDHVALGLGAGQVVVVVAGFLAAYATLHSPLPGILSLPLALGIAGATAALGWLRLAGRPALDWAVFATGWRLRPRRGTVTLRSGAAAVQPAEAATETPPSDLEADGGSSPAAPPPGSIIPLFGPRGDASRPPEPALPRPDGARRVTFFSLRGGTGRTMLATELACLLAAGSDSGAPAHVALIDLDLRSASVGVRLGIPEMTLVDYAVAPPDERRVVDFMVAHGSGVRVLPGPQQPVDPEWPVTPGVLREVLRELDMEGFDVAVLDLSPELTPLTTAALRACDDVFVVISPTAGGVHDAYRTTAALRGLGLRHQLRYVINRARAGCDVSEPMGDLGGSVIAEIPDDDSVIAAENLHRPLGHLGGPAAIALRRLALRVGREVRSTWPA